MRIVFLMHGIGWGGAAGSLLLLLKSINYIKAEKYLITSIDRNNLARSEFIKYTNSLKEINLPQLKNHAAGGRTTINEFKKMINRDYSELLNYLRSINSDIIHINSTVFAYILKPIKENLKIKIITHVRETLPNYDDGSVKKYIIEQIEKYSDKIICISNTEAEYFYNNSKVIILPNPFDFDYKKNNEISFRQKNEITDEKVLIAMSGQFSQNKGHVSFLKAVNHIKNNYDVANLKFIVFGVSTFTPYWKVYLKKIIKKEDLSYNYRRYMEANKLNNIVSTFPYLYTDEYFSILSEVDIYVRPSLAGDPWGRDIIESMAFGKPIIATGNSEYFVENGINGYLVEPNDEILLGQKIYELSQNKSLRDYMGKNNVRKIKSMCDLKNYGKKINEILLELLS